MTWESEDIKNNGLRQYELCSYRQEPLKIIVNDPWKPDKQRHRLVGPSFSWPKSLYTLFFVSPSLFFSGSPPAWLSGSFWTALMAVYYGSERGKKYGGRTGTGTRTGWTGTGIDRRERRNGLVCFYILQSKHEQRSNVLLIGVSGVLMHSQITFGVLVTDTYVAQCDTPISPNKKKTYH